MEPMNGFQNILFVITERLGSKQALQKAADLARENSGKLSVLVIYTAFPGALSAAEEKYKDVIARETEAALDECGAPEGTPVSFATKTPHAVTIIKQVLSARHDLVIKEAEPPNSKQARGFRSLDMNLLRKCPCRVWLHRDSEAADRILVAIDPVSEGKEGHNLSLDLLKTGRYLSQFLGREMAVISCWRLEDEELLRNSALINMKKAEVDALVEETRAQHLEALEALIAESGIGAEHEILHEKGKPQDIIPAYVDQQQVSLIVMGTVARTGIPGFIIGNTAENIVQELSCSMLAAKPDGFVSPVKA